MRVTNDMMMNNYLSSLNRNLTSLTDYQKQVSTGKAISSLSDDPVGLISVMSSNAKLSRNSRSETGVQSALTWLNQTDSSVSELNEVIKSAYETLVEVSNDDLNPDDKNAAAEYIAQLRDQVITIANGQSSDKYLFGGYNVNNKPFTADGSGSILYNGLDLTDDTDPDLITAGSQSIAYEVGAGISMDVSITGAELLGTGRDNVYTVLDNICKALNGNASAKELSGSITKLQDCQSHMLSTESKVGGMVNRLELLQNRYEKEDLVYKEQKSIVEDVDIAEAYMNYSMAEMVYTSALKVSTQIIQASILDYLK